MRLRCRAACECRGGLAAPPAMTVAWRTRVKPLLGTLVEISLPYADEAIFLRATELAFARVQAIHGAMSFHESTSDVRAIARARIGETVRVSTDTFETLLLALELENESKGAFNPTIAPELVARGLLPRPDDLTPPPEPTTLATSIALSAPDVVRLLKPVWIDLGGIAKGYAVDAATVALQAAGVADGVVNAGGDLRVFGAARHTLSLRLPASPTINIDVSELRNLSCATSGGYLFDATLGTHPGIVGARTSTAARAASVSVITRRCAVADALTKVLWLLGADDPVCIALLKRYEASAVLLDAEGAVTQISAVASFRTVSHSLEILRTTSGE